VNFGGARTAPAGASARNPAFDVTPSALVTAIITERAVLRSPYDLASAGPRQHATAVAR
jgi:methylthioribose-1-phosphate isomerase